MGPSSTKGATTPVLRRPATRVLFFKWSAAPPRRSWSSNDGVDAPRRHRGAKVVVLTATLREASVTEVSTIGLDLAKNVFGLDLAKNVFQAHGASASGAVLFRKRLRRDPVLAFFAAQPRCL